MLKSLTIILLCQLIGEIITRTTQLLIPGPVFGLMILFCGLLWFKKIPEELGATGATLLHYLPLLFVPAGVGIIVNGDLIRSAWLPITAAIVVGTAVSIAITGLIMHWALQWQARRQTQAGQGDAS